MGTAQKAAAIMIVIASAWASAIVAGPAWAGKPAPAPAPPPGPEAALEFLRGQIGPVGFIDSYVEDKTDDSYTYDNALAVAAFVVGKDLASAARILDAFRLVGPEPGGGFVHRYHASDGRPDGRLYAGANAYLLHAINLYFQVSGDPTYTHLAEGIAEFLLSLQDGGDGGIFGYPG
ncbi:MAG: hypothetical protein HYY19_06325, partial [Candidatus Rokubacteria bacterium]|nr:hypothetical protein [Candidatus Rokubacteria bacterium]